MMGNHPKNKIFLGTTTNELPFFLSIHSYYGMGDGRNNLTIMKSETGSSLMSNHTWVEGGSEEVNRDADWTQSFSGKRLIRNPMALSSWKSSLQA